MRQLVRESDTKIQKGSGSRHTIYLKKDLVEDTSFPLKVGEKLTVRIEGEKVVIEKAKKS